MVLSNYALFSQEGTWTDLINSGNNRSSLQDFVRVPQEKLETLIDLARPSFLTPSISSQRARSFPGLSSRGRGLCRRKRSTYSSPSLRRDSRKLDSTVWPEVSVGQILVMMNSSDRGFPESLIPSPSVSSFPYSCSPSRWVIPASIAALTESEASWQYNAVPVPNASQGTWVPSLRMNLGGAMMCEGCLTLSRVHDYIEKIQYAWPHCPIPSFTVRKIGLARLFTDFLLIMPLQSKECHMSSGRTCFISGGVHGVKAFKHDGISTD